MRFETELRRPDFLGGIPVELADDQIWAFPGPRELAPEGEPRDPKLARLLDAMMTAEDEVDSRRMELALAIYLIRLNYDLSPEETYRLLGGAATTEVRDRLSESFHNLAMRHAEAVAPRSNTEPSPVDLPERRFRFSFFRPSHRPAHAIQRAAS